MKSATRVTDCDCGRCGRRRSDGSLCWWRWCRYLRTSCWGKVRRDGGQDSIAQWVNFSLFNGKRRPARSQQPPAITSKSRRNSTVGISNKSLGFGLLWRRSLESPLLNVIVVTYMRSTIYCLEIYLHLGNAVVISHTSSTKLIIVIVPLY